MSLVLNHRMQIILFVQDMNSAVRFYQDVLELAIRYPENLVDFADQMWVEFDMGEMTLALHGGAERTPDNLHELVFYVENVAHTREKIIAAGIKIGEIRELEDGAPIAEGIDPAGHRFAIRA